MVLNDRLKQGLKTFLFIDLKLDRTRSRYFDYLLNITFQFFNKKQFNRENFNSFVQYLMDKGLKDGSINNYIALGKNLDKFLNTNILKDYKYFKAVRQIKQSLTPEEIKKIADVKIKYYRLRSEINRIYRTLIYFLATTGCRIEEALHLKKEDLRQNPYAVIFKDTKNGEQRIVPIADWLYREMVDISKEYVFSSWREDRMTLQTVNKELQKRAEKVGIKSHVTCHIFRHSFITEMSRQRVPLPYISRIVGHKDIESTNYYTQLILDDLVEAIYFHPILRSSQTFEMMTVKIKEMIERLVDKNQFNLSIQTKADPKKLLIAIS